MAEELVGVLEDDAQEMAAAFEEGGIGGNYVLPIATPDTLGGVKPAAKTEAMTQTVGVDENGGLWGKPSAPDAVMIDTFKLSKDTAQYLLAPVSEYSKICCIIEHPGNTSGLTGTFSVGVIDGAKLSALSSGQLTVSYQHKRITMEASRYGIELRDQTVTNPYISVAVSGVTRRWNHLLQSPAFETSYYAFWFSSPETGVDETETVYVWGWKR